MPVIACPIDDCEYATPDVDAVIAAAVITTHATIHSTTATNETTAKVEKVKRPTISSAGTSEDWSYFMSRWNDYVESTIKVSGKDKVVQFLECCDEQLRKDLTRTAGETLTNKSDARRVGLMASLFEDKEHAELYAKYRRDYPDSIYESIIDYCKAGDREFSFDLAVDIACGSGQGTLPLCKYFTSVVGVDISEEQISAVPSDPESYGNVKFKVGRGEDLSFLPNNSVDLLTVAAAIHWLPVNLFYAEVNRVLKTNGVFAAYGYDFTTLSVPEAEKLKAEFHYDLLADYWDNRILHIIPLTAPFPDSERRVGDAVSIKHTVTVDDYIGYLSTHSAWRVYLNKNPHSDALVILRKRYEQ